MEISSKVKTVYRFNGKTYLSLWGACCAKAKIQIVEEAYEELVQGIENGDIDGNVVKDHELGYRGKTYLHHFDHYDGEHTEWRGYPQVESYDWAKTNRAHSIMKSFKEVRDAQEV